MNRNSIFDLDESIGYDLEIAEKTLKRELTKRFHENGYNITPNQWVVLYRLWEFEGVTQANLSELTFKDRAHITRIIDLLEKKGYVKRVLDKNDRRTYRIFLTDSGRNLEEKLPPIVAKHIRKSTEGINQDDIRTTKAVLKRIWNNYT